MVNSNEAVVLLRNATKEFAPTRLNTTLEYFAHIVGKHFDNKIIKAIDSVNIEIKKGEKVGLLGLNGAGKSTLVKCMTGILNLTSGSSKLFGLDSYQNRRKNNFDIGVVFGQRCQLRWDLSPHESYKLLGSMYKVGGVKLAEKISHLSSTLDIERFLNQPVRSLSLGQKMRSELVATFLHDPEFVILDEPTLGLDIFAKDKIQKLLKESNKTILLASHDVQDIENVCDRVIILHQGRILYDGKKDDLSKLLNVKGRAVFTFSNDKVSYDKNFFNVEEIELLKINSYVAEFALRDSKTLAVLISHLVKSNSLVDIKWEQSDLKQVIQHLYGEVKTNGNAYVL